MERIIVASFDGDALGDEIGSTLGKVEGKDVCTVDGESLCLEVGLCDGSFEGIWLGFVEG